MGVQQQREKQFPPPGASREDQGAQRPNDNREQPSGDARGEEQVPVDDQDDDESPDEITDDPLTDPAAEPGKPI